MRFLCSTETQECFGKRAKLRQYNVAPVARTGRAKLMLCEVLVSYRLGPQFKIQNHLARAAWSSLIPRRSIDRASAGQSASTSSRSGWSQKFASASKSSQHMTMSR